ncbi:hypothetical protein P4H65_24000 [Paenibacillus chitinolyticus]|uniref:hypothetical protein n=1 Tax=Paenibacillus chitinolyticus TaxID=79263 RepID=UPI002DBFB2FA|nr:hypothetical protein [Paenibacillus chitinolyticus]MEC0248860.1 hypothetical protein [Paenibacillus chitinolyticus]
MPFVIQDMQSNLYLKHDGSRDDHPFDDVETADKAEQFTSREHACYAAYWYADMRRQWRVIDRDTGERFVKDGGRFKVEE